MSPSQSVDPLIGRLVDGRYRVRARIARGGMATVYVATDLRLERRIALKVMHSHLSDDSVFQSRFIQEARAAARLADPNVVNVFDQGQDGELAYLVMEYLPGITLRQLLKEERRLSVPQTVSVMDAILSGLAAAHRAGIVHRDVKPENVLLAEDGRIKIGDFGLARATTANTASGAQLMGTIAYLAPELVTRGTADARSDIYALGIMLYEILTGEQPYRGEQPMQIAYQHATESVPRPSAKNPGVPEQLDELVLWATERDPEERPLDAQVMLERLREIERELGITPQVARSEPGLSTVTAGLNIPEFETDGGVTAIMPPSEDPIPLPEPEPMVMQTGADDAPDNAAKLRRIERRGRRRGLLLLTVAIVLAVIAGGTGWFFGSGPGSLVAVADVVGESQSSATTTLRDQSFDVSVKQESSLTVPVGDVTRTNPKPGARLARGADVSLFISTGPAEAVLESFAGMSHEDAESALSAQRISIAATGEQFDDTDRGTVLALSIMPTGSEDAVDCLEGCTAHQGDSAELLLSSGPVPSVNGGPVDEARTKLTDAGLIVADKTVDDFRADPEAGRVIEVTGPDRAWKPGDEVTLHTSLGPIPDVVGMSEDDAISALEDVNLDVADDVSRVFDNDVPEGVVISIGEREGGGNWRPGDTISLTVSKGPDLVDVPDVTGMTRDEAAAAITGAEFQFAYSNTPPGILPADSWDEVRNDITTVSAQDPAGDTQAVRGSTISVEISLDIF